VLIEFRSEAFKLLVAIRRAVFADESFTLRTEVSTESRCWKIRGGIQNPDISQNLTPESSSYRAVR
jgi:hypothetical protein